MNYWPSGPPEGWYVEAADRSVGIMSEVIYHDDCPWLCECSGGPPCGCPNCGHASCAFTGDDPPANPSDPVFHSVFVGYLGWGWLRTATFLSALTCPDCKQTAWFPEEAWSPTPDDSILDEEGALV